MAHIRQSRLDPGLDFRVKVLHTIQVVPSSLGSGNLKESEVFGWVMDREFPHTLASFLGTLIYFLDTLACFLDSFVRFLDTPFCLIDALILHPPLSPLLGGPPTARAGRGLDDPQRVLPTETTVESGTFQRKSGTCVSFSTSG